MKTNMNTASTQAAPMAYSKRVTVIPCETRNVATTRSTPKTMTRRSGLAIVESGEAPLPYPHDAVR